MKTRTYSLWRKGKKKSRINSQLFLTAFWSKATFSTLRLYTHTPPYHIIKVSHSDSWTVSPLCGFSCNSASARNAFLCLVFIKTLLFLHGPGQISPSPWRLLGFSLFRESHCAVFLLQCSRDISVSIFATLGHAASSPSFLWNHRSQGWNPFTVTVTNNGLWLRKCLLGIDCMLLSPNSYCLLHNRLINWETSCWGKE